MYGVCTLILESTPNLCPLIFSRIALLVILISSLWMIWVSIDYVIPHSGLFAHDFALLDQTFLATQ